MSEPCWDCRERVGIIPAVDDHVHGVVWRICRLCHNKWRRYLKGGGPQDGFTVVVE